MSTPSPQLSRWKIVDLLAEPTRRRVFECVRTATGPMSRDDVAAATGINRRLATFHLDRLGDAGLLTVDYARPEGRGGPGAGRPAKRYQAAAVELDLSLPRRQYEFAARLLARAITAEPHDAEATSLRVAREEGRRIGALRRTDLGRQPELDGLMDSLAALGYEPTDPTSPTVRLRNCPFRSAAEEAPELVCGMNCELVAGLLEGLGLDPDAAELDPAPPDCCVTVAVPS